MGKSTPSPPPQPDPTKTASAQGASNIAVAAAQTALSNPNINTPYGSTTFNQTGTSSVTNPDGTVSTFPTYTENQTLSAAQQKLLNQNNALGIMGNRIAGHALSNVSDTLSNPITQDQLSPLQMSAGATPTLATGYDSGQLATGYDSGGPIQRSVDQQQAATTFGDTAQGTQYGFGNTAGNVQYDVDTAGIKQARDDATNAALARLQPSMDRDNAALQSQLANQGVTAGSSAYNDALLQRAGANNDLRLGAVQTGDAEQQALYGQALSSGQFRNAAQSQDFGQQQARGQFANTAQQQDFGQQQARGQFQQAGTAANNMSALAGGTFANTAEAQQNAQNASAAGFGNSAISQQAIMNAAQAAFGNSAANQDYQNRLSGGAFSNQAAAQQLQQMMGLQNQQINEISALRSGGQVSPMSMPTYSPGTIDQTPLSSDTYASANLAEQAYQAQLQNSAANTAAFGSAISGLTGSLGKKSDRRLKSDITRVATARNGLTIYAYRMRGEAPGWHFGFMADEVALIHPEAVWTDPHDGFARVDYDRAVA